MDERVLPLKPTSSLNKLARCQYAALLPALRTYKVLVLPEVSDY